MLSAEQQEEEFQEADILWPDAIQKQELQQLGCYGHGCAGCNDDEESSKRGGPLEPRNLQRASSPIDIPRKVIRNAKGFDVPGFSKLSSATASVLIGSAIFTPPHVVVDRRAKRDEAILVFVVPKGRAGPRKMRE